MTEFIENIFSTIFGNNVVLATILIAVVPVIELKGAIPFSMSPEIWGASALPYWSAFLYGLLGSCLVVPILALIYTPIINCLKKTKLFRKLALKIENRVNSKKEAIEQKAVEENAVDNQGNSNLINKTDKTGSESANLKVQNKEAVQVKLEEKNAENKKKKIVYNKNFFLKVLGVFAFVAIPLPLTGVWTGTCMAVALGLGFWWSCATVILGNVVAGLLITLVSSLFGDATLIFFYILIAIMVVAALALFIRTLTKKHKKAKEK